MTEHLRQLVSQAPPHKPIVFLAIKSDLTASELAKDKVETSLNELLEEIHVRVKANSSLIDFGPWIDLLATNMDSLLREIILGDGPKKLYRALLGNVAGETKLGQYFRDDPEDEIEDWAAQVREYELIAATLEAPEGQRNDAFQEVYVRYEKVIKGFFLARGVSRNDVDDITQKFWFKIFQKLETFHPGWGTFRSFLWHWAKLTLLNLPRPSPEPPLDEEDSEEGDQGQQSSDHDRSDLFDRLMRKTFLGDSPPHQLIVFAFVKLLEERPKELAQRAGFTALGTLLGQLIRDLKDVYGEYRQTVDDAFAWLGEIMKSGKTVGEILKGKTLQQYGYLSHLNIPETWLCDYCNVRPDDDTYRVRSKAFIPEDPREEVDKEKYLLQFSDDISNWCISVKKHVAGCIDKNGLKGLF